MSKAVKEKLSRNERSLLRQCEQDIKSGLRHFIDVGLALEDIRNEKLYREEFSTFEQYCQERWGMGRKYADRLIRSGNESCNIYAWVGPDGKFVEGMGNADMITIKPANESQVRPLLKLPEEKRNEVWRRAVKRAGMKQPTAQIVKEEMEMVPMGTKTEGKAGGEMTPIGVKNEGKTGAEMQTMVCKTEGSPNREMGTMGPKSDGKPDGAAGEIRAIIELLRPVAGRHQKISEAIARLSQVLDGFASTNKQTKAKQ